MAKADKSSTGIIVIVVLIVGFLILSQCDLFSREASTNQFKLTLSEDEVNKDFSIGDAKFRMVGNPVYTCGSLPWDTWVSYESSEKDCWEQNILFEAQPYTLKAEEQSNLNDYLAITWMPEFTVDIEQDRSEDWFDMNNQFIFQFIDYSFLDIELVRQRYGVVGQDLPVEMTITNDLFGFDGKLVHNYVEKKMGLETSQNIHLKYNQGTNSYDDVLDYPTTYIGDVDSTIQFVFFILGTEFTLPLTITDDYRVLAIPPSSGNPTIKVTSQETVTIDDGTDVTDDDTTDDVDDGTEDSDAETTISGDDTTDDGADEDKSNVLILFLIVGVGIAIVWGLKNR